MIQTSRFSVTLSGSVNERQFMRPLMRKKPSFECSRQRFRMSRSDKPAAGDCHSIPNMHDRIVRRTEFGIERSLILWLYGHGWIQCKPASGMRQLAGTLNFEFRISPYPHQPPLTCSVWPVT